jgi:resuscitation-promoting factor RpfA
MDTHPVIELRRAPNARRALAWAIDGTPFALLAGAMAGWLGADPGLLLPALAVVALAAFVHQLLCHWLLGAAFGQRLLGLRVVGPDGRRPGLGRSAGRAAASVLGVLLLGIGPLVALFTRSGRGLNDFAAGTAVVEAP